MSLSKFTTGNNGTRAIEAGDIPDWMDYFAVSVPMDKANILKGDKCQMVGGILQKALVADILKVMSPVVPTQSIDASNDTTAGDSSIRVMTAGQMVAMKCSDAVTVGQYTKISADGILSALAETSNTAARKYARYIGKEGAVFTRSALSSTGYAETLTTGIVPDQDLAAGEIGWFMLVESAL